MESYGRIVKDSSCVHWKSEEHNSDRWLAFQNRKRDDISNEKHTHRSGFSPAMPRTSFPDNLWKSPLFKIGHLHPLLKPGKSNSKEAAASNFRGITLTCILSEGSGESRASSDMPNIQNHRRPYPPHSLDFVKAIHALICCCQLLMTGSLHETQSYAQRSSSLTYLKLLTMWIINPFCSSFINAELEGQF